LFEIASLFQLLLNFVYHMSNTFNFTGRAASKKYEVDLNFNIFMQQQNKYFTNRYFKFSHKVKDKFTAIIPSYIKKKRFTLSFSLTPRPAPAAAVCKQAVAISPTAKSLAICFLPYFPATNGHGGRDLLAAGSNGGGGKTQAPSTVLNSHSASPAMESMANALLFSLLLRDDLAAELARRSMDSIETYLSYPRPTMLDRVRAPMPGALSQVLVACLSSTSTGRTTWTWRASSTSCCRRQRASCSRRGPVLHRRGARPYQVARKPVQLVPTGTAVRTRLLIIWSS
jgi:hypothetical protein